MPIDADKDETPLPALKLPPPSLLSADLHVTGTLHSEGEIHIDGNVTTDGSGATDWNTLSIVSGSTVSMTSASIGISQGSTAS